MKFSRSSFEYWSGTTPRRYLTERNESRRCKWIDWTRLTWDRRESIEHVEIRAESAHELCERRPVCLDLVSVHSIPERNRQSFEMRCAWRSDILPRMGHVVVFFLGRVSPDEYTSTTSKRVSFNGLQDFEWWTTAPRIWEKNHYETWWMYRIDIDVQTSDSTTNIRQDAKDFFFNLSLSLVDEEKRSFRCVRCVFIRAVFFCLSHRIKDLPV